jgi:hypothetical protein
LICKADALESWWLAKEAARFFRRKKSGRRVYLQIVENRWQDGRSKQRVVATLGRLDRLQQTGQLDGLLRSGAKFCESVVLLAAHRRGETTLLRTRPIGPAMIFERLWQEMGCREVIEQLVAERKFAFRVERADARADRGPFAEPILHRADLYRGSGGGNTSWGRGSASSRRCPVKCFLGGAGTRRSIRRGVSARIHRR